MMTIFVNWGFMSVINSMFLSYCIFSFYDLLHRRIVFLFSASTDTKVIKINRHTMNGIMHVAT